MSTKIFHRTLTCCAFKFVVLGMAGFILRLLLVNSMVGITLAAGGMKACPLYMWDASTACSVQTSERRVLIEQKGWLVVNGVATFQQCKQPQIIK